MVVIELPDHLARRTENLHRCKKSMILLYNEGILTCFVFWVKSFLKKEKLVSGYLRLPQQVLKQLVVGPGGGKMAFTPSKVAINDGQPSFIATFSQQFLRLWSFRCFGLQHSEDTTGMANVEGLRSLSSKQLEDQRPRLTGQQLLSR